MSGSYSGHSKFLIGSNSERKPLVWDSLSSLHYGSHTTWTLISSFKDIVIWRLFRDKLDGTIFWFHKLCDCTPEMNLGSRWMYIYKYSKHKTEQSPDLLDSFKHEVMNGLQLKNWENKLCYEKTDNLVEALHNFATLTSLGVFTAHRLRSWRMTW